MKIEIKDYILDKFKELLKREKISPIDDYMIEAKLNDFVEQNLDLII